MCKVKDFLRDRGRRDEEIIWCVWQAIALEWNVDDGIYDQIGNMHAFWTKLTGQ
jgi:hypothetical protein